MKDFPAARPNTRDVWVAGAVVVIDVLGSAIAFNAAHIAYKASVDSLVLVLTIAVVLLQAGLLVMRRAYPLLVALGIIALGVTVPLLCIASGKDFLAVNGVATAAAMFSLGLHSTKRWRDLAFSLLAAVVVAVLRTTIDPGFLGTGGNSMAFLSVLGNLGALALAFFIGVAMLNSRELNQALRTQAELAEMNAINSERSRIARELHDTTAHHLSAIAIQANAARALLQTNPDAAAQHLAQIANSASRALADVRATVGVLQAPLSEAEISKVPQPRTSDISALLDEARSLGQDLKVTGTLPNDLPGPTQQCVYRIVQEALTNARKHASGAPIDIRFSHSDLAVFTHGTFSGGTPGRGSRSMRERAHAIGAELKNEPTLDGWLVELTWRKP